MLIAFFTNDAFFNWAFDRHHNTLSWWLRPLMVLPFALAAWYRSWSGIWLSLVAMFSSMFWFPAPEVPDPKVMEFLAMEKTLLQSGWTMTNMLGAASVMAYGIFLGAALWKRSLWLGLGVVVLGGVLKMLWSITFSPEAGDSIIPIAIVATGFTVLYLGYIFHRHRKRTKKNAS
ncbi:hypothetical protein [Paraglaciecola sp.]